MSRGAGRWLKYSTRFDPNREPNESLSPLMRAFMQKTQFQAVVQSAFENMEVIENEVRQVLNEEGVATIDYPFYLAFAREIWGRIRRGIQGDSLQREVATLLQKWTSRGLQLPVLERVRDNVFAIGQPTLGEGEGGGSGS